METPKIFNREIFNNTELFKRRLHGDCKDSADQPCDPVNIHISMFDYILAWKMDLTPGYNGVFYDWINYITMSVSSMKEFNTMVEECGTIEKMLNTIRVHSDLFYGETIDVTCFYPALCAPPQPYNVCCMQWDAYQNMYLSFYVQTDSESPLKGAGSKSKTGDMSSWAVYQRTQRTAHNFDELTDAQILCVQSDDTINPGDPRSYDGSNMMVYSLFTSDQGLLDWSIGNVFGNYNWNGNGCVVPSNISRINAAAWPVLKDGLTYYSDVFGC